jgi:hypothetical protein
VDNSIEVRYAGVVLGRGAVARDLGDDGTFVGIAEPMPVGTTVTLKIGDVVREGHVDEVVESADPNAVGMRVRWGGVARTAASSRPAPAKTEAAPAAPAVSAAPMPAAPAVSAAPAPAAPEASAPATPTAQEASVAPVVEVEDASGAIAAPLSLAGPGGDGSHHGGGKRRRKRR